MAKRIRKNNGYKRVEISPGEMEYFYSHGQQRLSKEDLDKINQMRNEIIEEIFLLAKILGKDINSLVTLKKDYYTKKLVLEDGKPIVVSPNSDLKAALYYLHNLYYDYMLTMPEEIAYLQSHEYLTNDSLNMQSYERTLIKWGYPKDIFKGKTIYVAKKIFTHASNRRWKIAKTIEQLFNTLGLEGKPANYFFYSKKTTEELEEYLNKLIKRREISKELEQLEKTYNILGLEGKPPGYYFYYYFCSKDTTDELEKYLEDIKDKLTVKPKFS